MGLYSIRKLFDDSVEYKDPGEAANNSAVGSQILGGDSAHSVGSPACNKDVQKQRGTWRSCIGWGRI